MISWLSYPFTLLEEQAIYLIVIAFLVALPYSLLGCILLVRRLSMLGDAIGHSTLPGLVVAFLITRDLGSPWLIIGAAIAGVAVTFCIRWICQFSRIKQDAATGVSFTLFFAIGLILLKLAGKVHLSQDCILSGQISYILHYNLYHWLGISFPQPILPLFVIAMVTLVAFITFYHMIFITSFDQNLAKSMGYRTNLIYNLIIFWLSLVVVVNFPFVGIILVIALLIIPAATAYLITSKFSGMLWLVTINSVICSVVSLYLYTYVNCSFSYAMVVVQFGVFLLVWLATILVKRRHKKRYSQQIISSDINLAAP